MTQLEALKIAYDELSNMMPYGDENNEIFKAAEVIEKMIHTREIRSYKNQLKNSPKSKADKKRIKQIVQQPTTKVVGLRSNALQSC